MMRAEDGKHATTTFGMALSPRDSQAGNFRRNYRIFTTALKDTVAIQ